MKRHDAGRVWSLGLLCGLWIPAAKGWLRRFLNPFSYGRSGARLRLGEYVTFARELRATDDLVARLRSEVGRSA